MSLETTYRCHCDRCGGFGPAGENPQAALDVARQKGWGINHLVPDTRNAETIDFCPNCVAKCERWSVGGEGTGAPLGILMGGSRPELCYRVEYCSDGDWRLGVIIPRSRLPEAIGLAESMTRLHQRSHRVVANELVLWESLTFWVEEWDEGQWCRLIELPRALALQFGQKRLEATGQRHRVVAVAFRGEEFVLWNSTYDPEHRVGEKP